MLRTLRSDPLTRMLGHTTVVLVLLTSAYYLVPLRFDRGDADTWTRLSASLLALALLGLTFRAAIRRSRRTQTSDYLRIQWLLSALYALVLLFALLYAALGIRVPGQFAGIENRTDALYFSVTVVATVGFGDVHAAANASRLAVTVHMLFNLIYLGTALRVLTSGRRPSPLPTVAEDGERG